MPKAVEDCVAKVKRQRGARNAWAICQASHKTKSKRRRRAKESK